MPRLFNFEGLIKKAKSSKQHSKENRKAQSSKQNGQLLSRFLQKGSAKYQLSAAYMQELSDIYAPRDDGLTPEERLWLHNLHAEALRLGHEAETDPVLPVFALEIPDADTHSRYYHERFA